MSRSTRIFSKALTRTDITRRLPIPTACIGFFPDFNRRQFHVLYQGKVWQMKCRTTKNGHPVVSEGWLHFVSENCLKPGSVIVVSWEDEAGSQDRMDLEVYRAPRLPPPNGNLGVATLAEFTAEENESDDISANTGEALVGALLSRNTIAVPMFLEYDIEANRGNARDGSGQNYIKVPSWEWIFVVSNLTVELPSVVFDQLSSPHKPLYALMAMVFSLLALDLCVIDLLYKGVRGGVTFNRPEGKIPWFYYPPRPRNHKRFGTFADLIGLFSAISQCIVTAINYDFARRAADSPIKFSLLPVIFALGLLCSRILETVEKKTTERRDS